MQLSGTSVDGIDVSVCDISDEPLLKSSSNRTQDFRYHVKLVAFDTVPWTDVDKKNIFNLMTSKNLCAKDFCMANQMIGQRFAEAIIQTLEKHNIDSKTIDVIGSHGQTVSCEPITTLTCIYRFGTSLMKALVKLKPHIKLVRAQL